MYYRYQYKNGIYKVLQKHMDYWSSSNLLNNFSHRIKLDKSFFSIRFYYLYFYQFNIHYTPTPWTRVSVTCMDGETIYIYQAMFFC